LYKEGTFLYKNRMISVIVE